MMTTKKYKETTGIQRLHCLLPGSLRAINRLKLIKMNSRMPGT